MTCQAFDLILCVRNNWIYEFLCCLQYLQKNSRQVSQNKLGMALFISVARNRPVFHITFLTPKLVFAAGLHIICFRFKPYCLEWKVRILKEPDVNRFESRYIRHRMTIKNISATSACLRLETEIYTMNPKEIMLH